MQRKSNKSLEFFQPVALPHNLSALRAANLQAYCDQVLPFSDMLAGLKDKGWLLTANSAHYTMSDYLRDMQFSSYLDLSPAQLLMEPLPTALVAPPEMAPLPDAFASVTQEIELYIKLIVDVLRNKLAQKDYEEGIPTEENVSERMHAFEAFRMAAIVMSPEEAIAMLLHDIARPTIADQEHGHANHCEEGSVIAAPLGLRVDYTLHHGLAKYLLYYFCDPYTKGLTSEKEGLISPVSVTSLHKQKEKIAPLMLELEKLPSLDLAKFFFHIMFMRLIDDFSKVPLKELKTHPDLIEDEIVAKLLHQQLSAHLQTLSCDQVHDYENKLDDAIGLLVRAREYTLNASLYDEYSKLLPVLPKLRVK